MTHHPQRWLLLAVTLAALLTGGMVLAQTFSTNPISVGVSGGTSTSGDYTLHATIGQTTLLGGSSGEVSLSPGFGSQIVQLDIQPDVTGETTLYLPLVSR